MVVSLLHSRSAGRSRTIYEAARLVMPRTIYLTHDGGHDIKF